MSKACWIHPEYIVCSPVFLGEIIAAHVNNKIRKEGGDIGAIKFRVDDVPYEEDFSKMDPAEKARAWDNAVGTYGIRDIGPLFDSTGHLLAGGYMGSCHLMASAAFDGGDSELRIQNLVDDLVRDLIAFADNPPPRVIVRLEHLSPA
jgi:hypothetical protein